MKKRLLVCVLAVLLLGSCAPQSTNGQDVLRVASDVDIATLNYQKTASTNDMEFISQVMEGLLVFDGQHEVVPAGAVDYDVSSDGLTYTFTLRKDAKWSDGSPVVAADYYYAWLEIVANKTSPFAYTLFPIKNAEGIYNGTLAPETFGVTVVDEYHLEIKLEKPYLSFIYSLATATMFPIKQSFYEQVGRDNFGTTPETILTNGAYDVVAYKADSHLSLKKSETYWDKKEVTIPRVEVKVVKEAATRSVLFDNQELDLLKISTDYIEKYQAPANMQGYALLTVPTAKITYLYLSGKTLQQNVILDNLNLRKAITYGIDRQILTDNILKDGSLPMPWLVPCKYAIVNQKDYCALPFAEVDVPEYQYDAGVATTAFAAAQAELGMETINFEVYYQEVAGNTKILENIKFQLEQLLPGLRIDLVALPTQGYSANLRTNGIAAAVQTWSGSFPNPELYLQILEKDSGFNFGKFNEPDFQKYYHDAMAQTDKLTQFETYREAEAVALKEFMLIPLYQNGTTYVYVDNLQGLEYHMTIPNIAYKNLKFN